MLYEIGHWIYNWVLGWGGIGTIVSIALWAGWFFCPAILLTYKTQLFHGALIATAITLASTYMSAHYFNQGYQTAINQIAAKNKEATDAVNKATSNVDQCFASGGTIDDTTGLCDR